MSQNHLKFKTAIICGGSGFIGSNFIRYFYHKYPECRVINLDLLTYAGNPDNLRDIEKLEEAKNDAEKRYLFVRGDICDVALLDSIFQKYKPELVVNFAAESHVDRSIVNSYDFIRTNVEGVRSLMEAARKFKTPRFLQVSTDEIYGSVPSGQSTEESPLRPSNPYAASKAAADLLVQSYMKTHRAPAVIIRGSNNFGPYQYPEKLIPLAITNMLEGGKIPVHGTGEHIRSWLHVLDFCSAIDLVAREARDYSIYNASGTEKSNIHVMKKFADYLGKDFEKHKEHVGDRPGADIRYSPNSDKIKRELGWEARRPLDGSIAELASWYSDNSAWWKKLKETKAFQDHYDKQSKAKYY